MLLRLKLRLLQDCLGGSSPDHVRVRRFCRFNKGIRIDQDAWRAGLEQAARHLGLPNSIDWLILPINYAAPTLHLVTRQYNQGKNSETFECFKARTIITFDVTIDEKKSPDPATMLQMWNLFGSAVGMSEFGSKFGYGRFEIESIGPVDLRSKEFLKSAIDRIKLEIAKSA